MSSTRSQVGPSVPPRAYFAAINEAVTCELATLTRSGAPVTSPLTPYPADDGRGVDVSCGLAYPAKAERARGNPKVAVLFSDPVGRPGGDRTVVAVRGLATVHDSNLQANTDRYVRLSAAKIPMAMHRVPRSVQRSLDWYFARIWITVTPLSVLWWPDGDVDAVARRWDAPAGTSASPSDPPPPGHQPTPWRARPAEWQARARTAVRRMGLPVLTTVDGSGFPSVVRCRSVVLGSSGFQLSVAAGSPSPSTGPACVTFHAHDPIFTGQENAAFAGTATVRGSEVDVVVDHAIGDWTITGSMATRTLRMLASRHRLRRRLPPEAARRGQEVPKVNLPPR